MSTTHTKHQMVFETVRKRIESGKFRPGDRIPTDAELVSEFKVSRPTVAKALQELEREGLVSRRPGSGTYVQKTSTGGKLFGLLIPGLGETEIFELICAEMARQAHARSHSLLWGGGALPGNSAGPVQVVSDSDQNERDLLSLCDQFIAQGVAGVFFTPLVVAERHEELNRKITETLSNAGIPIVLLDRDIVGHPDRSRFDLVGIDNRRAGDLIAHHMIQQGCKRLSFVAHPFPASTIDARIAGFSEASLRAGLPISSERIHLCRPSDVTVVKHILDADKPDAIVCGNDSTAGELLHSLDTIGVHVPNDLLVGGIDDVRFAELFRVPLTTIRQPCAAIGRTAFEVMVERIANPESPARDVHLGCELVVRRSTTRP